MYRGFNPHPHRGAGAASCPFASVVTSTQFQSSPAPRCGCCAIECSDHPQTVTFQSSPAPRCGCCHACPLLTRYKIRVSILTRTEVRVLPSRNKWRTPTKQFQSSPAPRCGCCFCVSGIIPSITSFNPHPHRGAGAASHPTKMPNAQRVSILTRTEVRVLHLFRHCSSFIPMVSILTRTEVRVLPTWPSLQEEPESVSILTRTEVRVLLWPAHVLRINFACFNPHPHRGAGAAHLRLMQKLIYKRFQSSPAPRCGCCAN